MRDQLVEGVRAYETRTAHAERVDRQVGDAARAVETIPSFAPSTEARSQPMRSVRWCSRWERGMW